MSTDIKPGYYRHYKGKLHRVHFVGIHSETLEPLVCYESLYRNQKSRFWVRPAAMFSESVPLQGQPVLRFSRITDDEGRSAEQEFRRKNQPFKHNAVVYVRSGRYTGHGLVNCKDGYPERCPETQVPVLLENGNTWWYPAEYVEESTNRNQWPGWIRRRKRVKKRSPRNSTRLR